MATHFSILGLPWWLRWEKHLPAMQETRVCSLGWEDLREATLSNIFACRIPMDRGAWQAMVIAQSWKRLSD